MAKGVDLLFEGVDVHLNIIVKIFANLKDYARESAQK